MAALPNQCHDEQHGDEDRDELHGICYQKCQPGFLGLADQCWMHCPPGFATDGAFCHKPKAVGRGQGSLRRCQGCDKWGMLWYPLCPEGYHREGCCMCSADCLHGMEDLGLKCGRRVYSRGHGRRMTCPEGKEISHDGLCYDRCLGGTEGIGSLCWGRCPMGTTACGSLCLPIAASHEQ